MNRKIALTIVMMLIVSTVVSGCSGYFKAGSKDYIEYGDSSGKKFHVSWWSKDCPDLKDEFARNSDERDAKKCLCSVTENGLMLCEPVCTSEAERFNHLIGKAHSCD